MLTRKDSTLLIYKNTGPQNCFDIPVRLSAPDSFYLSVSHLSYETVFIPLYLTPSQTHNAIEVRLFPKTKELSNVTVTPSVWKRDDTTFFNADYFLEGEEKKLKDLIVKMPGFRIDRNGTLYFNNKVVEKALINGEEIFSDKVKLLLNSLPVHVLSTVQAIENQSSEKLLKGLTSENKVFLNLAIKEEKIKAAFGDGEAGIGTRGRYKLAPVIFSLFGKLKLGLIANWNSIGEGTSPGELLAALPTEAALTDEWQLRLPSINYADDFEARRYIRNNQWQNRLQINHPIAKNLRGRLEIALLRDKQIQLTSMESALLTDTGYFNRKDTYSIVNRPALYAFSEKIDWDISPTKGLKTELTYFINASNARENIKYFQEGVLSDMTQYVSNKLRGFSISSAYTHRINREKAIQVKAALRRHLIDQHGNSYSTTYAKIFALPDQSYTGFLIFPSHNLTTAEINTSLLRLTKKKKSLNISLVGTYEKVGLDNNIYFTSTDHNMPEIYPALLNQAAGYKRQQIIAITEFSNWLLRKQPPLSTQIEAGLGKLSRQEAEQQSFGNFHLVVTTQQELRVSRRVKGNVLLQFAQRPAGTEYLNTVVIPGSFSSLSSNAYFTGPLRELRFSSSASHLSSRFRNTSIQFSYTRKLTGFLNKPQFTVFLQTSVDTLIRQPGHLISANVFHSAALKKTGVMFRFSIYHFQYHNKISINNQFMIVRTGGNSVSFGLEKSWRKTYFIRLSDDFIHSFSNLPSSISRNISKNVLNNNLKLWQRVTFTATTSAILNLEWQSNNIFTTSRANFLLADIELTKQLKGRPWSFYLRLDNLTNQKKFYRIMNSERNQTIYQIPLIGRNIFATVRYEL